MNTFLNIRLSEVEVRGADTSIHAWNHSKLRRIRARCLYYSAHFTHDPFPHLSYMALILALSATVVIVNVVNYKLKTFPL